MNRGLAWILAVVAALAGCAQPPAATTPPSQTPQVPLLETDWRPVEIEGAPFSARPGTRQPYLVLSGNGNRVRGFTGCNNLAGSFEQEREGLRFKPLASTRMACLPESDLEARFLSAVNATASHRVTGDILEFRDAEGRTRMRLQAQGLK